MATHGARDYWGLPSVQTVVHDSSKATVIDGATVYEELEQQLRININNP